MDYDTYCCHERVAPDIKISIRRLLMIYLAGTEASAGVNGTAGVVPGPLLEPSFRCYSSRRGDPAFRGTYWYYFDKQ